MANINAYQFTPRKIDVYADIWDDKKKKVTPIKSMEMVDLHMVLDSLTHAVEAGVVDTLTWPQQFFANKSVFMEFIEQLDEYDVCYRITDQWWQALAALAHVNDEEGFISTEDIAAELFNVAAQDGLLENWGKKNPVLKFSVSDYEKALYMSVKRSAADGMYRLSDSDDQWMRNALEFGGRHFESGVLSRERYRQAEAEGLALRKKVVKKTDTTTKKKTK